MPRRSRWCVSIVLLLVGGCGTTTSSTSPDANPTPDRSAGNPPSAAATPSVSLEASLIGATAGVDPFYPQLGNGGYDVQRYEIGAATNPATNDTSLNVVIEAVATQRLGRFSLDYSGIEASVVEVDGSLAAFEQADEKLSITPAGVIEDGATFRVSIDIAGQPAALRSAGWTWIPNQQVSAFGLYDALPSWLPVNADPADKAIVEFRIAVPRPYVAIAPGVLIATEDVDGGREFRWQAGPTSQITLAVREYEVVDIGVVAGIPVRSYQPADLPQRQQDAITAIPAMLEFLGDRYGPFPFDGLNLVWVEGRTDLRGPDEGMLHWGPDLREPRALAHHLTHIWFQVNVTPRTARESYLRAAFANYGDLLWIEHSEGTDARDKLMAYWYSQLGESTDPPADPKRIAANEALFSRGPLSLHALRVIVGDDHFFAILRTWVTRFHRGAAGVDDFVGLAEGVSGQRLDTWEAGWLRGEAVPSRSELGLLPD